MKNLLKTFSIMFKYAFRSTLLKVCFTILTGSIPIVVLWMTERIVDGTVNYLAGKVKISTIAIYVVILVVALIIQATSEFFNNLLYIDMKQQLNKNLNPVLLKKFTTVEYKFLEDSSMHDTLKCMSKNPQENIIQLFISSTDLLSKSLSLIGSIMMFAQARIWYVPVFFILIVPMLWCDFKCTNVINGLFEHQSTDQRRMEYMGSLVAEKDTNFELRILNAFPFILDKWSEKASLVLKERTNKIIRGFLYYFISIPLYKIWMVVVVLDMMNETVNYRLSIGVFTVLMGALGTLLSNSDQLSHGFQNIFEKLDLVKFFARFLELPDISCGDKTVDIAKGVNIEFENVSFTYPQTDKKILDNISFKINANQNVALVGENGAGKSTIIKLLCRLYEPDSGSIKVNGIHLKEYKQEELAKIYSVMFQDYGCYAASLRENIAFSHLDIINDDQKIKEALNMNFGESIGENIDMVLGKMEDEGVDLSGGQWQKVALARTYISDAGFRILDEPTAALDPITESRMYQAFTKLIKGCGCLIVSHRLPSAKMADSILVLANGIIAEQGKHEELLRNKGIYSVMWNEQSKWYGGDGQNGEE